jgi:hypothetical protein
LKFHVHIDASQLVVGQYWPKTQYVKQINLLCIHLRLFNYVERNYTITKKKALAMVYALHKFRHYMLGNMFTFYVDHMALMYVVKKP